MKKLFLLVSAFCLTYAADAQQNAGKSVVFKSYQAENMRPDPNFRKPDLNARNVVNTNSAYKSTGAGGSRWYLPFDQADAYLGGNVFTNNQFVFHIDWDSLLTQKYNTGYGPVNWLGIAQFIDPINSAGFNSTNYYSASTISIKPWNAYTVDSISFPAAYIKSPTGGTATIDTLYLSVAPVAYNDASLTSADYAAVTSYSGVTSHGGVMKIQRLGPTDSFNRQLGNAGAVKWKVPLIDTLRKLKNTDGTYPTRQYTFAVPSPVNVPAGSGFAISIAFKPGEAWANGDSVQKHHYFMPISAQKANSTLMPYFYYDYNDHCMSSLMHYANDGGFSQSIALELANTIDFNKEFHDIAGKVTCATCATIGSVNVNTLSSNIGIINAYPNPTTTDLFVKFDLKQAAETKVIITNAVGQVMATQDMGNVASGKASFNTNNFANGVYFYTVEANGQHKTDRFVVAH